MLFKMGLKPLFGETFIEGQGIKFRPQASGLYSNLAGQYFKKDIRLCHCYK